MAKIALLVIHGIGEQAKGYAEPFIRKLRAAVGADVAIDAEEVAWHTADGVAKKSIRLDGLCWKLARRFVAEYAGDLFAYQAPEQGGKTYGAIHQCVDDALSALLDRCGPKCELVIVAHSLGTIITSNFLWDIIDRSSSGRVLHSPSWKSVKIGSRLRLLYTLGSPLALASLRFAGGGKPIPLPANTLWHNVYSPCDVIGFPVKRINGTYALDKQICDEPLLVGGPLSFWNPLSHMQYFDSPVLIRRMAKAIKRIAQ